MISEPVIKNGGQIVLISSLQSERQNIERILGSLNFHVLSDFLQASRSFSSVSQGSHEEIRILIVVLWLDIDQNIELKEFISQFEDAISAANIRNIPINVFIAHPSLSGAQRIQERVLTVDTSNQGRTATLVRRFRELRMLLIKEHRAYVFHGRKDLLAGIRAALRIDP